MPKLSKPVFICAAKRSPIASFGGAFQSLSAVEIGREVVHALFSEEPLSSLGADHIFVGNVLQAGIGQAPARQVALKANLSKEIQAITVNKVCSSGLSAVILASNAIQIGDSKVAIAGGMESMSQAPYLMPTFRFGARLGDSKAVDSIVHDGLTDPFGGEHMGSCAELCSEKYTISREEQDAFALQSYERALKAQESGAFTDEMVPFDIQKGRDTISLHHDEEPTRLKREKVGTVKAVFKKDGSVTAVNASSINDGASMLLLASEDVVKEKNLKPLALIRSTGWHGQEPEWFTTAPVGASKRALADAGLSMTDISLVEVNEAFSVVALAVQRELEISSDLLNVNGGAVALGHPIGCSGARILTTLVHALRKRGGKYGLAAICNGGGEATAMVIESL